MLSYMLLRPGVQLLRLIVPLVALLPLPCLAQSDVLTQHNDVTRAGAYPSEQVLNTSNVNVSSFGLLNTLPVDSFLTAQVLYKSSVTIGGKLRNVVYIATNNDSLYCYDADDTSATAPLWKDSFINPPSVTAVPKMDVEGGTYTATIGIRSTPVIDPNTNTLYCVVYTLEGDPTVDSNYHYRLHGVDLLTGAERPGSPVEITAQVPGTGDQSDGTYVSFNARRENQRPALLLANGNIYIAWAGHADIRPYHGWVMAYNARTYQQVAVHCDTPNSYMGGIWMSGQGMAADSAGNVYYMCGNGIFTADPSLGGGIDYGNSIVKLSPSLKVLDYFTPFNQADLQNNDWDLGSSGMVLIPNTNLIMGGGKQGYIYLTRVVNMGRYNTGGNDNQILQKLFVSSGELMGSPVFWYGPNGAYMFVNGTGDNVKQYQLVNGLFNTSPTLGTDSSGSIITADPTSYGNQISISSYGRNPGTGILWIAMDGSPACTFHAFDAVSMKELWNSEMNSARDRQGAWAKFNTPTIAGGKVFEPTNSKYVCVYGLLNQPPPIPPAPSGVRATPNSGAITITWSPATYAANYTVKRSKVSGTGFTKIMGGITGTHFVDNSVAQGTRYFYVVDALNANGTSPDSFQVSAISGSGPPPPPPAPQNLTATGSASGVTLEWAGSSGTATYSVLRSTTPGTGYALLKSGLTTTSYFDSAVSAHTVYYYVVTATNSNGTSGYSNEASATPGGTVTTIVLSPVADSYTHSTPTDQNTNFGTSHFLRTKYATADDQRRIYMKFDLSGVTGTIKAAKLMIYGYHSGTAGSTGTDFVYTVADNTWTETGITWNNQPPIGTQVTSAVIGTAYQYWTWDISSYITTPGGLVSLAVQMNAPAADENSDEYNSRESGNTAGRPQLVLTVVK